MRAICEFLEQCEASGIQRLEDIEAFVVSAYVQHLGSKDGRNLSKASVKHKLAAIRKFFSFLVVQQVIPKSPAVTASGPSEDAAKTIIQARLKRSGMRWPMDEDQHILDLRAHFNSCTLGRNPPNVSSSR